VCYRGKVERSGVPPGTGVWACSQGHELYVPRHASRPRRTTRAAASRSGGRARRQPRPYGDAFGGRAVIACLGLAAGLFQLVGYLLYVRDDGIAPNPVTWLMFAYGTLLVTALEWDRNATLPELLLPGVCSSMAVFVAVRCWWRARRRDPARLWPRDWWPSDWRDRIAFQTDVALTVLYLGAAVLVASDRISGEARDLWVAVFLVAANLTTLSAFFPLVRGVIEDPSRERTAPWAVWTLAYTLLGLTTYAAHGELRSELMLYPALNAILHGSVAVLSRKSRRELSLSRA
jgi:hypothetical protein